MYEFLNTYTKRKAFRKAMKNAFDNGYDVSKGEDSKVVFGANKVVSGVTPITLEEAKRITSNKTSKTDLDFVDLSKHKNWRAGDSTMSQKTEVIPAAKDTEKLVTAPVPEPMKDISSSRGATLYDELFGKEPELKNEVVPTKQKSQTNIYLDNQNPITQEEKESNPWEELFAKLKLDTDTDEENNKPVVKEETKPVEVPTKTVTVVEKKTAPDTKKKVVTKTKAKKRKNKVKFDADIIGGW